MINNYTKVDLKKAELFQEDGKYYFRLLYLAKNDAGVYEVIFPKVCAGIPTDSIEVMTNFIYEKSYSYFEFDTEENRHQILADPIIRCVEKKTHEMTIEEIEKKLGYKIKIVGQNSQKNPSL